MVLVEIAFRMRKNEGFEQFNAGFDGFEWFWGRFGACGGEIRG
jgi:hypothetical protein